MLQNKKLSSISLIKFVIDAQITPKLLSIDFITDILRKVMPAQTQAE